jgi:phosphoglycerol transferase MdoB-like AlkP superfamily enzyme
MKVKILHGYPFLWPRNFQSASNSLLAKLGVLNPLFYTDDLFIAFIMLVVFYCIFKKNNSKLDKVAYVLYFATCFFSILSALVFYKYEVPLNLAILSQIDSLYTMRTSIDTELRENYRLIWISIILLLFAVAAPVFVMAFISNFFRHVRILEKNAHFKVLLLTTFFLLLIGLLVKNKYAGLNVIAETPLTTFSYSVLTNFQSRIMNMSSKIPRFNDQMELSHSSIDHQRSLLANKHRKKYNVILVVLETTNYHFFLPGGPYIQYFPNLDHMGKQGLYFSKFFSPFPRSSKAFFAILSGCYPLTNYKSVIKVAPQIQVPTLFSILKNNDYSTFAGYSGDFNYDRMADFLKGRGVDRLVDIKDNKGQYKQISWCADDELIYDRLIHWISALPENDPFFGLLLPMNSHHPFWAPKKELAVVAENSKVDQYLNAMHYQDHLLGKLFRYLKDSQKLDNTIVVVTGDHGAVFKTLEQGDGKNGTQVIDYTPYRVPLFIYTPFETPSDMENDIIGNHVDILPTILDMLGIGLKMPVQGRSLFDPLIKNRMSYIYTDYYKHIVTGLNGNYYMMRDMTEDHTVLSNNLHLHPDICENSNELCQRIRVKIDDFDQYQNQRLYEYF